MASWEEASWGELDGGGIFEWGSMERRVLSGIPSSQALSQMRTVNWGAGGRVAWKVSYMDQVRVWAEAEQRREQARRLMSRWAVQKPHLWDRMWGKPWESCAGQGLDAHLQVKKVF